MLPPVTSNFAFGAVVPMPPLALLPRIKELLCVTCVFAPMTVVLLKFVEPVGIPAFAPVTVLSFPVLLTTAL
jgi:hypothetical protein